jgi:hypothetical protein
VNVRLDPELDFEPDLSLGPTVDVKKRAIGPNMVGIQAVTMPK